MRKRDCLYLHALHVLVREAIEERHDVPDGAFETYDQLDVGPTAVHRPKPEHQRACSELLDALCTAVGESDPVSEQSRIDPDEPN